MDLPAPLIPTSSAATPFNHIFGSYGQAMRTGVARPRLWLLFLATAVLRSLIGDVGTWQLATGWARLILLAACFLGLVLLDNALDAATIWVGRRALDDRPADLWDAWSVGWDRVWSVCGCNVLITVASSAWLGLLWVAWTAHGQASLALVIFSSLVAVALLGLIVFTATAELAKRFIVTEQHDALPALAAAYTLLRRYPGAILGLLISQILIELLGLSVLAGLILLGTPSMSALFGSSPVVLIGLGMGAWAIHWIAAANSLVWTAATRSLQSPTIPQFADDHVPWPRGIVVSGAACSLLLIGGLSTGLAAMPLGTPAEWAAATQTAQAARQAVTHTAVAGATATQWAGQWQAFTSPEGDFTLEVPGRMVADTLQSATGGTIRQFTVPGPDGLYIAGYTDLPVEQATDEDQAFDQLAGTFGADWYTGSQTLEGRGPLPRRVVILFHRDGQRFYSVSYLAGRRLYWAGVRQAPNSLEQDPGQRFLASFHIAPALPLSFWAGLPTATPSATTVPTAAPSLSPTVTVTPLCNQQWAVTPAPWAADTTTGDGGDGGATIAAIAIIAGSDPWAVGWQQHGDVPLRVVRHWSGTQWMPSPDAALPLDSNLLHDPAQGVLRAIAGTSASDLWAAGTDGTYPLLEHWDGHTWRMTPSLTTLESGSVQGLFAVAPNDVWAVGILQGREDSRLHGHIWHWNGQSWQNSVVPADEASTNLRAISGSSGQDLWAVGSRGDGVDAPIILHWNGTAWQSVAVPNMEGKDDAAGVLLSVSATSTQDAWAVGTWSDEDVPLLLHWDGAEWSRQAAPIPTQPDGTPQRATGFAAVSATAGEVWLLGDARQASADQEPTGDRPFVAHWDGHRWSSRVLVEQPAVLEQSVATNFILRNWPALVGADPRRAWVGGTPILQITVAPNPCDP